MRMTWALLLSSLFPFLAQPRLAAAEPHLVPQQVFDAVAAEISGERAQETTRQLVEYHRIQGSPMMADVAERVVLQKLKAAGIEARIESFPSDGKRSYQTHRSPMGWDMRGGELWVESVGGRKDFVPMRLCRYSDIPTCVSTYSKGGEWSGELVEVGRGTSERDYEGKDVRGKVALASGYAGQVVRQAVLGHGAVGVVIYPAADDRPEHPDMVRYNGLWTRAEELDKTSGGFQISANQYTELRQLMQKGPVRVRGRIDATLGPGKLTLVHAYLRGQERPEEEVLITAHLDHPKWCANDNASGSATILEMARALKVLLDTKKVPPLRRTIHFMWVPEFFGTMAYVTEHPEARRCGAWDEPRKSSKPVRGCVVANLNLDMTGEDTVKTGSRFYITRAPDSVPSFLDALLADTLAQTREANLSAPTGTHRHWPTELIPYAQGSDHDVFLGLGVPAVMFGHDPDWTHHTSEDTVDKTDPSEFRRVGTLALAAGHWIAAADAAGWQKVGAFAASHLLAVEVERSGQSSLRGAKAGEAVIARRLERLGPSVRREGGAGYPGVVDFTALVPPGTGQGPRRRTLLPIYGDLYRELKGEDKKWWEAEDERFSNRGEGLPTQPTLEQVAFETVNFMDGRRSPAEIAALLSAEYLMEFDGAWVDRLVRVLASLDLVAMP
ncbi:MAG TPA: DUF4910 domain-containing protein [Polyangia bacterium]|nr:DUF4910 domain-containing protein [Polyangia bacterium]